MNTTRGSLVIAEIRAGEIRPITWELVAAAKAVAQGEPVWLALIGDDAPGLAGSVTECGATEILAVPTGRGGFEANVWQAATESLIESLAPRFVLTGFTVDAMGFAPAVAARRGLGFASDVTAIDAGPGVRARRGAYSDKLVADLSFEAKETVLLMMRSGAYAPAPDGGAGATVRTVDVDLSGVRHAEVLGYVEAAGDGVDITKSDFLLSIGRGIQDEDNVSRFSDLADALGATLSVSRPLVDAGWVDSSRQVGQSGKTVKPKVYLALGISGAVQHLAGIREAETIIAVNSDPEAPIFSVSHYGVVADLFDVADALSPSD